MNHQSLIIFCLFFFFSLFINNGVESSHEIFPELQSLNSADDSVIKPLHRTGFHFQPRSNWINDPNGPMYFNGLYHLFYQYNPKGSVWGNIVWAHSYSKDLINWKSLKHAISPSKHFDINGCWSGSATILPGNKPVILYTGLDPQNRQIQNYAVPANLSDPFLTEWLKPDAHNPIIDPGPEINASAFRDPTTAWQASNGVWKIVVGGKKRMKGVAYLYRSKDFLKWVKAKKPLHATHNTGMWECPDFFPVAVSGKEGLDTSASGGSVKYVFKVSLDLTRYEYYTVGMYDSKNDRYIPDDGSVDGWGGLRLDYGNFYASKTFYDPAKKRRVLWGWANESDSARDDVAKGWAGIQAVPRTVWLDPNGKQVVQWPVEELDTLRETKVVLSHHGLNKGENVEVKGITPAQADVEATFSFSSLDKAEPFDSSWVDAQAACAKLGSMAQGGLGPFGLLTLASENLEEFTPVFFRIFKNQTNHVVLLCSDARSSSLKTEGLYKPTFAGYVDIDLSTKKLSLRTLIDHSVVESYGGGGKTCITSRVYPTKAVSGNAHLFVFNNGTEPITVESLSAWNMKSVTIN